MTFHMSTIMQEW